MRLLRVELKRLWARRLTRWMCVAVLALVALTGFTVFSTAHPPTADQLAEAETLLQQELDNWEKTGEEQIASCEEAQAADPDPNADYLCDDLEPKREWFLPSTSSFVPDEVDKDELAMNYGLDPETTDPLVVEIRASPWNQWSTGTNTIASSAIVLLAIVFAIGASLVTAEVTSGALGLWLTFEPRRQRVFWSKAAAAGIGTLPFTVVGTGALVGAVYAVYAGFGTLGELTTARWEEIAGYGGRLVAAGVVFAVIGAALGALFKHAAATVGAALAVGVGATIFTGMLGDAQRWGPVVNVTAWIESGAVYGLQECAPNADGVVDCLYVERAVTQTQGGLYLLALTALLMIVAALVFRRRDVS